MRRTEAVVLICILALAVGMRVWDLRTIPPGLYPDEAVDGNNAVSAWESKSFAVFYPANNGEEGLFANLAAVSIHFFGHTAFALRLVSAIAGSLTVLGLYLLAKRMFDDWEIAATASFLMAVGFWHVHFSRIGFRAILAPLMAVWAFYYFFKAIETHRLWHWALSGLFLGLGMYTYIAFRVIPLAIVCSYAAYWLAVRQHFGTDQHHYTRKQALGGYALLVGVALVVFMPLAAYFAAHPGDFVGRATQVSVFSADNPALQLLKNTALSIGMFFFYGDGNWRHNYAGAPALYWPVAALFAVGLIRTIQRFISSWRTRGHPGLPQTILLSWFFLGLLPEIFSNEGLPHALRALTVAPAVYLIAALGLHWLCLWLRRWYAERDEHQICLPFERFAGRHCVGEGAFIVGCTTIVFLLAIGYADASRYFHDWAHHPNVPAYFNQRSVDIAVQLNAFPPSTLKYVVTQPEAITIDGIPVAAQTVMYLTDTATSAKQKAKHLFYLTPEQFKAHRYPAGALLFHL